MEYMNFNDVNRFASDEQNREELLEKAYYVESHDVRFSAQKQRDVFLSHSSKDKSLLPGIVSFLSRYSVTVYIDKEDKSLPKTTSSVTGERLKEMIDKTRKFILLVSPNSKDSKWIPWELGLGDEKKGIKNVALLPTVDSGFVSHDWPEQEYLGLYPRIVWNTFKGKDKPEWMVLNHHDNKGIPLYDWLKKIY